MKTLRELALSINSTISSISVRNLASGVVPPISLRKLLNSGNPGGNTTSKLTLTMRINAQKGIMLGEALFQVSGPGAPSNPIAGTNQLGAAVEAQLTLPQTQSGQFSTYSVSITTAFFSYDVGSGYQPYPYPLKSSPIQLNLTTQNRLVLFTLKFDPQTDLFFIHNDGVV